MPLSSLRKGDVYEACAEVEAIAGDNEVGHPQTPLLIDFGSDGVLYRLR